MKLFCFCFLFLATVVCGPVAVLDDDKFKIEIESAISKCMTSFLGTGPRRSAAALSISTEVAKKFLVRFQGVPGVRKENFENYLKVVIRGWIINVAKQFSLNDPALAKELPENAENFVDAGLRALDSSFTRVSYSVTDLLEFQAFLLKECEAIFKIPSEDLIYAMEEDSSAVINRIEGFPSALGLVFELNQIDFVGSQDQICGSLAEAFEQNLALPIVDAVVLEDSYLLVNFRVQELRERYLEVCRLALSRFYYDVFQPVLEKENVFTESWVENLQARGESKDSEPGMNATKALNEIKPALEVKVSTLQENIAIQESKDEHDKELISRSENRAKTFVSLPNFDASDAKMVAAALFWRCCDLVYSGEMFDNLFPVAFSLISDDLEVAHRCIENVITSIDNLFLIIRDPAVINGSVSAQKYLKKIIKTSLHQSFNNSPIGEKVFGALVDWFKSEMMVTSDSNQIYDLWNLPVPQFDEEEFTTVVNKTLPEPQAEAMEVTRASSAAAAAAAAVNSQIPEPQATIEEAKASKLATNAKTGIKRLLELSFSDIDDPIQQQTFEVFSSAIENSVENPQKKAK